MDCTIVIPGVVNTVMFTMHAQSIGYGLTKTLVIF